MKILHIGVLLGAFFLSGCESAATAITDAQAIHDAGARWITQTWEQRYQLREAKYNATLAEANKMIAEGRVEDAIAFIDDHMPDLVTEQVVDDLIAKARAAE